jgi:hypothetical protein
MALNFPNSPTNGQIYTDTQSGNRWVWDSANTAWLSTSTFTQTITVSSTQPGSPVVGQLWWNQDYGRLLVYYNDGTSSQWVDASPSDYTSALAYAQANAAYAAANNVNLSAPYNTANQAYITANAAFAKANTGLQNTTFTLAGNLSTTGSVNTAVLQSFTSATPTIFRDGAGTEIGRICRAWLSWSSNGRTDTSQSSGTPVVRASFNISSVTYNAVGNFTTNFTNSFSDANFCCVNSASSTGGYSVSFASVNGYNRQGSISASAIQSYIHNNGNGTTEEPYIYQAFYR